MENVQRSAQEVFKLQNKKRVASPYFYFELLRSNWATVDSAFNRSIKTNCVREAYGLFEIIGEQSAIYPNKGSGKKAARIYDVDVDTIFLTSNKKGKESLLLMQW